MKLDISRWIKKACARYPQLKLGAYYIPHQNMYLIHRNGLAVMNFTEDKFDEIDPNYRLYRMFIPLLKVGAFNNLSNSNADTLINDFKTGIKIC